MRYALLLYAGDGPPEPVRGPRTEGVVWLKDPDTATTIAVGPGGREMLDSPAAKPVLGWLVVDCPDLDAAIDRAGSLAEAQGRRVEIRPVGVGP